ncbi:MAG: glycoside hydrolase family 9 protein [Saprospiraceae bacterium]|nr:glycoside hydrolase family 9 protein [Saprospiraceae bacterium]
MYKLTHLLAAICLCSWLSAQNTVSTHIRLDQFGYRPNSKKVAVLADPVNGFDAAQSFAPGNNWQVRRVSDQQVVFSGAPTAWKNGATHAQSGDRGWWFDFSAVNTPGDYYLFDVTSNVRSYPFRISADVYKDMLKQAVRMYFYQRLGFAKQTPFVPAKWTEDAAYEGPNQDHAARSRWAKNDPSTARDVHGGWMDAGDVNKYTTFAEGAVIQLLESYRRHPEVFTDDFNIPESGNGIPDLLDEVMWELDWLKRMQDATGTNGFLLKLGVDNYNEATPPSADTRPRYYLPECTSATLAGCAMFAHAGIVLSETSNPVLQAYGNDLTARAELAWQRALVTTSNFTQFEEGCDDGDIKSGDADRNAAGQLESAVVAAVYLFQATGNADYKNFVETTYDQVEPISNTWWGPYKSAVEVALLRFSEMQGVTTTIANNIRNQKGNMNYAFSLDSYDAQTDLYRAQMDDWAHHWGSNLVRSNCGSLNMDFVEFNINADDADAYRETAEQYLHWLHGTNAMGIVMLSNMYEFGGDACANEIYHTWFGNNTEFDNALTSPKGPAPGYLTGGPNKDFSYTQLSPPAAQPPQKSYLDFNDGWPESSWEISEPAIYYNAAYIMLLSNFVANPVVSTTSPSNPETQFELFPNPAGDRCTLRFSTSGKRDIRVFDANGKIVLTRQVTEKETYLDLKNLPAGVYSISVAGTQKQLVKQ